MKKKKITKIISFLLVLILLISFPLESQANALATESWMVYALITYLAGMGITFAVSGGVDAMIQSMEEKVKDYEQANNIIDFYDYLRNRNVRLVPNNNQDPDGNPFFDLFFTASAVEAIQTFVNWLTSDGGWFTDSSFTENNEFYTSFAYVDNVEEVIEYTETVGNKLYEQSNNGGNYRIYATESVNFFYPLNLSEASGWFFNSNNFYTLKGTNSNQQYIELKYEGNDRITFVTPSHSSAYVQFTTSDSDYSAYNPYYISDVVGFTVVKRPGSDTLYYALVMNDGNVLTLRTFSKPQAFVSITESLTVDIPLEIPRLTPEQKQGVIMQQFEIGSPEIQEWANMVEELFIQTGTIPNPQPEIIQDPDYAPVPTPVPTPVPSPEIEDIEDLGLPTLGDAIFSKFPFSLPKDVGRIFKLLHAEPVTPYWQVDLTGDALGIPSNFEVDLAEYEILGQITRWFSVVSYCLFLILITRGMIKW